MRPGSAFFLALASIGPLVAAAAAQAEPSPAPAADGAGASTSDPLDYVTLSHTISIDSLRAGSHDPSGTNDYYFTVTIYGLLNTSDERNVDLATKKKIVVERGVFGDTKIDALAIWKPDEKLKNYKELKIEGNAVRELAARTMTEFKAQESDIAVMIEVALFEKSKRFFFFGDDTAVAKTSYYPIPPSKFDAPLRTNQSLAITDDKGTLVKVGIKYDK